MSYLVADVKDKPVSALFHLDFIEQLRRLVQRGMLRRHGRYRGVLFGRTDTTDGHRTLVTVEGCEPAEGLVPIGIVRSWVRGHLYLEEEDRDVLGSQAGQRYSVLLVIRSSAVGPPVAGAFLFESGQVIDENSFAEFPLDSARIRSGGFTVLKDAVVPEPQISKRPVPRRGPIRTPAWALIPVGAALLALCAFALRNSHGRNHSERANEPIYQSRILLSLQRLGNDLLLRWDPDNPTIRAADRAVLRINDGSKRRNVLLDAAQLQVGAAQYRPVATDVEFQLEIPGPTGATSDPIRFISPEDPGAPAQRLVAVHGSDLPGEARLTGESDRAALASSRRRRPDRATVHLSYDPLPPSALRRAVSKMRDVRLLQFRNSGGFVPPRASHQVTPLVTASTARQLSGERSVQLRANIDKNGRVTDVQPISAGADEALVSLAEGAIRRWEFSPARLHNRPTASAVRFTVRYENPSRASISANR